MKESTGTRETKYIQYLKIIRNTIFDFRESNISESVKSIEKLLDSDYPYSSMLILSRLIYSAFILNKNDYNIVQFLKTLSAKYYNKIINIFTNLLLHLNTQESNYLLGYMIEQKMVNPKVVRNIKTLYFIHYKTDEEINAFKDSTNNIPFHKQFFDNIEELKKDDWKLHKQLIHEGSNPSDAIKAIRNDDVEKLHEISSEPNFDFKQNIEPSLYERYSFINKEKLSLVDYAAFFGSIKCFKYLILNNVDLTNTGIYAVAGGNLEILYYCEQNHSNFNGSIETAIEFHRNEIFYYFFESEYNKEEDFTELGKKCITYDNYEILSFLETKKLNVEKLIIEAVENGNIFLFRHFSLGNKIPKETLISATRSGNIEIVKLLLEKEGTDVNVKYVL